MRSNHEKTRAQGDCNPRQRERILRCLGASVIIHWDNLPKKLRPEFFDSAGAVVDLLKTKTLRTEIAQFLHAHNDDRHSEI